MEQNFLGFFKKISYKFQKFLSKISLGSNPLLRVLNKMCPPQ